MRRLLASIGVVVLATLVATWPLVAGRGLVGHPLSDLSDHFWGAWWFGGELLQGRLPLETTVSHLPAGKPLWYVDPLGAALTLPLRPLGMVAAYNLAALAQILLGGLAAWWATLRLSGSRQAAAAAGVVVVSSPYLLGLLHSGLTEYLGLLFPVLFLYGAMEAARGRRNAWLLAGLAMAGCTLQAFYYGAFAALAACCLVAGPDPRGRLRGLGRALALGLALSLPIMLLAGPTVFGADGVVDHETAPGWRQASLPATDLALFLKPAREYFPDTPALGNPGILHVHYLGWVALILGTVGFLRHPALRPHALGALLIGVMSLGPALAWSGAPVRWGGSQVPLPLAIFYILPGSPFDMVHHPYRLVAFVVPLLAMGVGGALAGARWLAALAVAGLVALEGLMFSPAVWPLPVTDTAPPAIYAQLPDATGGVLDWPPDGTTWNRRYVAWQVHHGQPLAYGVNLFLSREVMGDPLVARLLRALDDPAGRARNRDVPVALHLPPAREGETALPELGISYLVLHPEALSPGEAERAGGILREALGQPLLVADGRRAWALSPVAVSGTPGEDEEVSGSR